MKVQISKKAESLLRSAFFTDKFISKKGKIHAPIPILNDDHTTNSWFAGVVVDTLLAGFFQIDNSLELIRYSSFQRRESSLDGCPEGAIWLNKETILARAKKEAKNGEQLSEPVLTYDANPSRVAWAVTAINADNTKRTIYVTGDYAYTK